jgi:hypothetical protein
LRFERSARATEIIDFPLRVDLVEVPPCRQSGKWPGKIEELAIGRGTLERRAQLRIIGTNETDEL